MASLQNNVSVLQTEVDYWRSKQSSTAALEATQLKIVNLSLQSMMTLVNNTASKVLTLQKADSVRQFEIASVQQTVHHIMENQYGTYDPKIASLNASIQALRTVHSATVSEVTVLQGEQIYLKNTVSALQKNLNETNKNNMKTRTYVNTSLNSLENRFNSRLSTMSSSTQSLESRIDAKLSSLNGSTNVLQMWQDSRPTLKRRLMF